MCYFKWTCYSTGEDLLCHLVTTDLGRLYYFLDG